MSRSKQFHVFTPQRDNPEDLEKILVKRHDLLTDSVEKIRASILGQGKHHLLFVGPRGMGKSYLVTLIHHRLSRQADLRDRLRFAWLNEDQTSTTFLHLLARIYRRLVDQYPQEFSLDPLQAIRGKEPSAAREILSTALIRQLGDRTVVLLLENIDLLFRNMSQEEQLNWRAFIQNYPVFATVATAQGLTDDLSTEEQPFYLFFDLSHLGALNVEEATELLEKIALLNGQTDLVGYLRTSHGKARLRAIHHLSGGNPRLYFILSDFLTRDSLENLVQVFEETVDRQLTPYFQERMRWLSAQQQEIVQFLCQQIHPASVKEIAEAIFAKPGTTSSQLKQLRENGYLIANQRGRESLYELAEPLMRLSFQVKESNDRQPLTLIVDFLRVWYDREDLEKRISTLRPNALDRSYFEAAIRKIDEEGNNLRHDLIRSSLEGVDPNKCDDETFETLRCLAEDGQNAEDWIRYGFACEGRDLQMEAIGAYSEALNNTSDQSAAGHKALLYRALTLQELNQISDALADYEYLTNLPQSDSFQTRVVNFAAHLERGNLYHNSGKFEEALKDLNTALEHIEIPIEAVTLGLISRAETLTMLDQHTLAIKDANRVLKIKNISQDLKSKAFSIRGRNQFAMEQFDDAIADFTEAIKIPDETEHDKPRDLFLRGLSFLEKDNLSRAISDFQNSLSLDEIPDRGITLAFLAVTRMRANEHNECIVTLKKLLNSRNAGSAIHNKFGEIITYVFIYSYFAIFSTNPKTPSLHKIYPLFSSNRLLRDLGSALTMHLLEIRKIEMTSSKLEAWATQWEKVAGSDPEMEIPLRLHRVGIEWIKTRDDDSLLSLVKEERKIVREALGLEPENE